MSTELIAATATWALIGYLLDRWLGTAPWLLVIGALLGNAAGIYLIWLRSDRMEGGSRFVAPGSTHGTGNDTDGTVMDGVGPDEPRASATPAKPAS